MSIVNIALVEGSHTRFQNSSVTRFRNMDLIPFRRHCADLCKSRPSLLTGLLFAVRIDYPRILFYAYNSVISLDYPRIEYILYQKQESLHKQRSTVMVFVGHFENVTPRITMATSRSPIEHSKPLSTKSKRQHTNII